MERFRYALVGCGEIAVATSDCILKSDAVEVVACMDVTESLAADLAGRHGVRHTTSYEDILADESVDAVILSTPHFLHAPQTIAAAGAGKHVLTEKPIACDLSQADAMIAATDAAGVKLDVLYPVRFSYPYDTARQLVADGAIGEVTAVGLRGMYEKPETYWTGGYSKRAKTDWRMLKAKAGGGMTLTNMSHNLDALVAICDMRPTRIYAEYDNLRTPDAEVEDVMAFVMRLEGGAIVNLLASSAAPGKDNDGDRIYGRKGQLHMTYRKLRVWLNEPHEHLPAGEWIELTAPEGYRDGRLRHVEDFAVAVATDGEPPVSGRQARRALEIIRGAYLSMERGRPVDFPVVE